MRAIFLIGLALVVSACGSDKPDSSSDNPVVQPPAQANILFIVTDDQSWQHTSLDYPYINTPNIEQLAEAGTYFSKAYVSAPSCTPSRAAILLGKHVWQTESAALLEGAWPAGFNSYQDNLAAAGYYVGFTGKGWGPGAYKPARNNNPAGREFNQLQYSSVPEGIDARDLAANFRQFLDSRPANQPFSFWVGSTEPHRPYGPGDSSRFAGIAPQDFLPPTLPDTPAVRREFSAYLQEIEWFDNDLGKILQLLKDYGLESNTLVVFTSDNGMPFSGAKPQNYEYGVHVPLIIRLPADYSSQQQRIDEVVSLVDITATLYAAAQVTPPEGLVGSSLLALLTAPSQAEPDANRVAYSAYERHGPSARANNATYPRRAVHSERYLYVRNYFIDRWPNGDPPNFTEAYPWLLRDQNGQPIEPYFSLNTEKRPAEELYDIVEDPANLNNLIDDPDYAEVRQQLAEKLLEMQTSTEDPVLEESDYFSQF
ncbi:sulfatase [Halioxenophilus sp. WMMB6]|uniref:sulfatase family protein n=1 Tax=Halioxenophilus sp. WMMB6 TaxID=3073815 RepID=UPI00295EFFFD|nr:sulfatase [Halioxenophilus sp. WMMB6]